MGFCFDVIDPKMRSIVGIGILAFEFNSFGFPAVVPFFVLMDI